MAVAEVGALVSFRCFVSLISQVDGLTMAAVQIVTDSTSDLPSEIVDRDGIEILPLGVCFGDDIRLDRRDIDARQFYELLETRSEMPHTEPPTQEDFEQVFRRLSTEGDVLAVLISRELSRTVGHAEAAAEVVAEELDRVGSVARIVVIDSRTVALNLGLFVVFAARMSRRGLDSAAIAVVLRRLSAQARMVFVTSSLDYLARGGKIGRARALIGKVLGANLCLQITNGEVGPADRPLTRSAIDATVRTVCEGVDPERPSFIAIAHARAPVWAHRVTRMLSERLRVLEVLNGDIGPAVAAHVGPGVVGAAVIQPTDEELEYLAPDRWNRR